jgi:hypothetical protein
MACGAHDANNWITWLRWRCSNTASSPLCVRVGVTFSHSHNVVFLFFLSEDYVIYLVGECALGVFSERSTCFSAAKLGAQIEVGRTANYFAPEEIVTGHPSVLAHLAGEAFQKWNS